MTATKTLLLGAAAALSLSLSPALAEMLSSPQELAQTRALNASARSGTYTSPCTLNGEKANYKNYSRTAKSDCPSRHARAKTHRHASTYARDYHATTSESGRTYGRMTSTQTAQTPTTYNSSSYRYGPNGYSATEQQTTGPTYGMNGRYDQNAPSSNQYQANGYGGQNSGQYANGQYRSEGQMGNAYGESGTGRMPYGAQGQTAMNAPQGENAYGRYSEKGYGEGARGTYEEGAYAPPSRFNPDDFVSLKAVDADRLDNVSVETSSGIVVGHVTDVELGRDGAPSIVALALNDGRDVRISASTLKYSPNDRVLLTNLDQRELMAMAGGGY